jgi:exopolysaccharide biosynthesis protein
MSLGYQTADRNMKVTTGIMAAMGRGGVYVAAGKNRANCNHGNEELRPRTLIGWNSKTGDQFFVTVQGKYQRWGVRWGGATVHQAADYMLSLGADTAICLDGGGSTTMVIRTKVAGTPVHIDRSNPKDGQRPVVNVIGIVPMTPLPPKPTPSPSATPTVNPTP